MKSQSFGNFQIGMVDDPSNEDQGGFEIASGMDIFSESGVMKASLAMEEVSYGTGAAPTALPTNMVDMGTVGAVSGRAYIAAGDKILESTNGSLWNLFLTNANGTNLGLGIWNGYVVYPAATKIGRAPLGNAAGKNDNFITTLDSDTEYHPVIQQAGTLKIGAGRYVASLDEAFTFTARAMKLPADYRIRTMVEHFNQLYMGTRKGEDGGAVLNPGSSVFSWRGIPLAAGTALPDNPYPMEDYGMNALFSDSKSLFAFPDYQGQILQLQGSSFGDYRKLLYALTIAPGAVCQHKTSVLFGGTSSNVAGVFMMKNGAICMPFVPSAANNEGSNLLSIGFVKTAFAGSTVYIGYYNQSDNTYHVERTSNGLNRQNGAFVKTLWHRMGTDKDKRWGGVKLNAKPLPGGTSVSVYYRTSRDAAFSASQGVITSSNQNRPLKFSVHPRSREIQFKFKFTTSTVNTPELLSYDPLFEVLSSAH